MSRPLMKVCIAILACLVGLSAMAGEGRIPIWQYPTVIVAPGKYIVTRNIFSGGVGAPIIDIQVHDVDIDINGFTLDASGSAAPVINIADDIVDVVIRNGMLVGGTESIERGPLAATVGERVVIEDIQSEDATGSAIHLLDIREVVIRRTNILDPGIHGIHLDRTSATAGFVNGEIDHCAIRLPGGDGIHVDHGSAFAIRHNRIEVASNHGIHIAGIAPTGGSYACLIGENTISDADGNGIFLERAHGTKVYNNVISRGETNGIVVDLNSGDNFLLENLVRQSGWAGFPAAGSGGGSGIVVDGVRNNLEGNTANENDACGFLFNGPDNTFGKNLARFNDPSASGSCPPAGACNALPAPDYCDTLPVPPPPSGNDSRGDNMATNPPVVGPF